MMMTLGMINDYMHPMQYNKMVKAAYDKLSEEEVQKRKENYWKEKEEYKREMARLGKTIPPIKQYKVSTKHG